MEELQGAVIVAQAVCPEVRFRLVSETTMRFNFLKQEEVDLFLQGIAYSGRLRTVVYGMEVLVEYVD